MLTFREQHQAERGVRWSRLLSTLTGLRHPCWSQVAEPDAAPLPPRWNVCVLCGFVHVWTVHTCAHYFVHVCACACVHVCACECVHVCACECVHVCVRARAQVVAEALGTWEEPCRVEIVLPDAGQAETPEPRGAGAARGPGQDTTRVHVRTSHGGMGTGDPQCSSTWSPPPHRARF